MAFIKYTESNRVIGKAANPPRISINVSSGRFMFNVPIVNKLDMKIGTRWTICNDGNNPQDWYLYFDHRDGIIVRNGHNGSVLIHHKVAAKKIQETRDLASNKTIARIGDPVDLYGVHCYPLLFETS